MLGLVLVIAAGFVGGAINSVAGGGSFLTFPALIFAGVAPIEANATSTLAMWPASLASAVAYRGEPVERRLWITMTVTSLVGGLLGAVLLVRTSQRAFSLLVPFLLLMATVLFTFGDRLFRTMRAGRMPLWAGVLAQLAVAVYGGYFGGGIGILMLALFTMLGLSSVHSMNYLKNAQSTVLNGVAVLLFAAAHAIVWREALVMAGAGVLGGYLGARLARRVAAERVRRIILVIAWVITVYFFLWSFGGIGRVGAT